MSQCKPIQDDDRMRPQSSSSCAFARLFCRICRTMQHAKVEKSKSTYEDQYSIRAAQTRSTIYE